MTEIKLDEKVKTDIQIKWAVKLYKGSEATLRSGHFFVADSPGIYEFDEHGVHLLFDEKSDQFKSW